MKDENIFETTVPGSFELPLAARFLALSGTVDAIVATGVLIKGEVSACLFFRMESFLTFFLKFALCREDSRDLITRPPVVYCRRFILNTFRIRYRLD